MMPALLVALGSGSTDDAYVFSFINIRVTLGLDVHRTRRALLNPSLRYNPASVRWRTVVANPKRERARKMLQCKRR